jgi:gamma-glutamylcyclotransferase (GGCT)/AIG2-like uncharacterized protein YtfP
MPDGVEVFVYGSLLRGEPNHHVLREAARIGTARTAPAYRLVDLGPHPGMVAPGTTAIVGEVYRVPEAVLAALDALEDHPDVYVRTRIPLDDGREVLTYLLRPHLAAGQPAVPGGDWRAHRRSRERP